MKTKMAKWDSMSGSYGVPAGVVVRLAETQPQPAAVARPPQWFAVQTRYRFEKRVVAQLNHKSCEVYLPLLTEQSHVERQAEGGHDSAVPRICVRAYRSIPRCAADGVETAGLIGFVSFGGMVVAVPPKQIEDLQLLLLEKGLFSLHAFVHTGQRVRIRGGCLHGLEGVLVQHEKGKLVISIESIQRSLAIEIEGYELELV